MKEKESNADNILHSMQSKEEEREDREKIKRKKNQSFKNFLCNVLLTNNKIMCKLQKR